MIDYRIAVHIGMTGNAAQFIQAMLRELTGVHTHVGQINAQLRRMAALAAGAAGVWAGKEMLTGVMHVLDVSKDLNNELSRMKALGGEFSKSVTDGSALRAAVDAQKQVPVFSVAEHVRMQREVETQMQSEGTSPEQSQAAARALEPIASKIATVVSQYTGEAADQVVKNLIKIADIRGKIFTPGPDGKEFVDPKKVQTELDAAGRGLILGGNYIKSNDMLQMARQAGVPAKGMSVEGFYASLVEMAVSQGAARTGTATTSLYQQLVGGVTTLRTAEEMQRFGLLRPGEFKKERGGRVVVNREARERLQGQIGDDPIAWITGPLNEMMNKQHMTLQDKLGEVFALFGRQTVERLVAEALSNAPQFARAREMFKGIPNPSEQYKTLMDENYEQNVKALTETWKSFLQVMGNAAIPSAIKILQDLTSGIQKLEQVASEHPEPAANIMKLTAAFGGLLVLGGSLVVFSIALRPFVVGLRLLVTIAGLPAAAAGLSAVARALAAVTGIQGLAAAGTGLIAIARGLAVIAGPVSALLAIFGKGGGDAGPLTDIDKKKLAQRNLDEYQQYMRDHPGYKPPAGWDQKVNSTPAAPSIMTRFKEMFGQHDTTPPITAPGLTPSSSSQLQNIGPPRAPVAPMQRPGGEGGDAFGWRMPNGAPVPVYMTNAPDLTHGVGQGLSHSMGSKPQQGVSGFDPSTSDLNGAYYGLGGGL